MGICNCKEEREIIKENAEVEVPNAVEITNNNKVMLNVPTKRKISSVRTFLGIKPNDEKKYNHLSTEKLIIRGKTFIQANFPTKTTQMTRTSSIEQNKTKLSVPYSKALGKSLKSTENVDILYTYTNKEIEEEEELQINEFFKSHPLFRSLSDENLLYIIDNLTGYQIKKDSIIFNEGEEGTGFFIIKKGSVQMIGTKGTKKIIYQGDSFGEMALFYQCQRVYTVIALEDMQIYMMERELYKKFVSVHKDEIKFALLHLNSVPWIKSLDVAMKNNLAYVTFSKRIEKNKNVNENYNKMIIVEKVHNGIHRKSNDTTSKKYNPLEYFGINFIFPEFTEEKDSNSTYIALESTSCFVLENKYLEESLGLEYRDTIRLSFLKSLLFNSQFFPSYFIESQLDEINKIFEYKCYKYNQIVYDKELKYNKKLMLIIEGGLIDKNGRILTEKGDLFGEEIITSNIDLPSEIYANPYCFVLESSWQKVRKLLKNLSHGSSMNIFKRIDKLKQFPILLNFSEPQLVSLANVMQKEKYKTGEYIYSQNSTSDKIYLINSGRIKITKDTKLLREHDEGCSFGEISVLNEENRSDNAIAASNAELYTLRKNYFFNMIDDYLMEYLKNKICLEDDHIKLQDLYYITFLGKGRYGNVCLVHNRAFLYAVKFISTKIIEKQKSLAKYILSEKEIVLSISHPFIVKHVKTLKNDHNLFYLMEYISGINMEDYLNKSKTKKNLYEASFYTACLLHTVAYLHRKCIIHRDIKPANIIIDKRGTIKLIDFGTAKIIKDMAYTVIGTPHYIAPEVLSGKGYAFSCDLWSIAVLMYYIYYGILPFGNAKVDVMEVYKDILNKEVSFPDNQNSSDINNFLTIMLDKKHINRSSNLDFITSHNVFKDINWDDLINCKMNPPYIPKDLREWTNNLQNLSNSLENAVKNERFKFNYDSSDLESSDPPDYNTEWLDDF